MLSGKVAIVTGASRGIGRETALTLAGYGATVIVNYCGSKDKAEAVVEEIKAAGAKYCDCPACAACEAILAKKDEILA